MFPFGMNLLFLTPSSDRYCAVSFKYLLELVTSDMRTQPILEFSLNHLGEVIGLGDAPLFIVLTSPKDFSSQSG